MAINTMTGAEFKERFQTFLNSLKDDDEVFFGSGDLTIHEIKPCRSGAGAQLYNIEFNEVYKITSE